MPRASNPSGWVFDTESSDSPHAALVSLRNARGHRFSVHPLDERLVRVVHELPSRPYSVRLRSIRFEARETANWHVDHKPSSKTVTIKSTRSSLRIELRYELYLQLSWYWDADEAASAFLRDFKTSYTYDEVSGRVWHYTYSQGYMPTSESQKSVNDEDPPLASQNEFVYGLGEAKGRLNRIGKRYLIDGRDSLGADPEETDPLYKLTPFYIHHDASANFWYGMFYNTLNPSVFDFAAEHDFSTGNFHSFSTEHGPLDYYVLLGTDADDGLPTVPGIVSQLARLVTPFSTSAASNKADGWQAAPTLPALSQFGYLASSLTLSERTDAQAAVVEYVREAKSRRFGIDGMHLSSGYCQDALTNERHYFTWNRIRYPEPSELGVGLEKEEQCQVVINVKPWLLETHPEYTDVAARGAFVKAAPDALAILDRCGAHGQSRTWHWSSSMGQTLQGSYFDFSSSQGAAMWRRLVTSRILSQSITGLWIDNNEMSTLIDDCERFAGEESFWSIDGSRTEVNERMAGFAGETDVGAWGRAIQTMGMAKASYQALVGADPDRRPVIVTRSAVPGMQTFACGTWSGDNSTTWKSFAWSTKLTLSYGLSFGIGLYGHDVGGFAGEQSPSADLLIRWCQQAAWHTRFTVHSWKKVSTTLWMFDSLDGGWTTDLLRRILDWRYQLVPMLYSLYVCDYFRRGWPVLRPLLWYHSRDRNTLTQDAQFLVGSHILVAPILDPGTDSVTFNLPTVVGHEEEAAWWYDYTHQRWYGPLPDGSNGRTVKIDCPRDCAHSPFLIRGGGTFVRAPKGMSSTRRPIASRQRRLVSIVPAPTDANAGPSSAVGEFTLIEDDGESNAATRVGAMTEIKIQWQVVGMEVHVRVELGMSDYLGTWLLEVESLGNSTLSLVVDSNGLLGEITPEGGLKFAVSVSDDS